MKQKLRDRKITEIHQLKHKKFDNFYIDVDKAITPGEDLTRDQEP